MALQLRSQSSGSISTSDSSFKFPTQYIDWTCDEDDLTGDELCKKRMAFLAASAVSLLCYEKNIDDASKKLKNTPEFQFVHKNGIVSEVWPLATFAENSNSDATDAFIQDDTAPIIAWSTSLQVAFIGFRGTDSFRDILSSANIKQSAQPDTASRFHEGFFNRAAPYSSLISQLAQKFNVIVCGHSLGGALATVAAYQAVIQDYVTGTLANVWQKSTQTDSQGQNCQPVGSDTPRWGKISVVTFGAPSMMVLEPLGTTAVHAKCFTRNFHHILNGKDIIPFVLNEGIRIAKKVVAKAEKLVRTAQPRLDLFFDVLAIALKIWTENNCPFGHFGRLYTIESVEPDTCSLMKCQQILGEDRLPNMPGANFQENKRFHRMEHYHYCLIRTVDDRVAIDNTLGTTMTCEEFYRGCLPLPEIIEQCTAMVYDNNVVVSAKVETLSIQFFTQRINFQMGAKQHDVPFKDIKFKLNPSKGQTTIMISHLIPSDSSREALLSTVDAIQNTLRLQDSFGRNPLLRVAELRYATMKDLSLKLTYEFIRDMMVMGFAQQMAYIGHLRVRNDFPHNILRDQAGTLVNDAKIMARTVDFLVANANPHLVLDRFVIASWLVQELWDFSPSPFPTESLGTKKDANLYKEILQKCPTELQDFVDKMLKSFKKQNVFPPSNERDWSGKSMSLSKVYPEIGTLTKELQKFSMNLFNRGSNVESRFDQGIEQSRQVLLTMRFYHTIILTQLEPRGDLWMKIFESRFGKRTALGGAYSVCVSGLGTYGFVYTLLTENALMAAGAGVAGVAGITAVTAATFAWIYSVRILMALMETRRYQEKAFNEMLQFSLVALTLQDSNTQCPETAIAEALGMDAKNARSATVQKKWKQRLSDGLRDYPSKPKNFRFEPTSFWVNWLCNVATIGELRKLSPSRVYVGVEGPTEVGKSLLLTTLTNAHEKVFRPGWDMDCRTTEFQSHTPPNLTCGFCDCPGWDDKNSTIKELARLFRGLMNIVVFVIPSDNMRSDRNKFVYERIVEFIKHRSEPRPFRILINKIDAFDYDETRPELFEKRISSVKERVIQEINREGSFPADFAIQMRQSFNGAIITCSETLEDIVQPYSNYAQMSKRGFKALSACAQGEKRRVEEDKHQDLYRLAQSGLIWDVESLRQWLAALVPGSVPTFRGRVL